MTRRSLLVLLLGLSSGGEAWAQARKKKGKEKEPEPEKPIEGLDEVPTKAKWYFDDLLRVATIVSVKYDSAKNRLVFLCTSKVSSRVFNGHWALVCQDKDEVEISRNTHAISEPSSVVRGKRFRLYVPLPSRETLEESVEIRFLNPIHAEES